MGDAGRGGGRTRVRAWAALTTYGGNIKQAVAVLVEQGLPAQGFEPEPEPEAEEQLGQLAWAKNWAALNAALHARRDANAAAERHLGCSPMFAAAFKGTPRSIVGLLAAKGVDVGWADENGMTALHRAAAVGHAEVVRALGGTHGADLNQRAKQQRRHSAARRKGRGDVSGQPSGIAAAVQQQRMTRLEKQQVKASVVLARILAVASNPQLSGTSTTVHVLKYKRNKERYIILLQPELGDTATKSLCPPASLVLAVGTTVIVSGLTGAPELNCRMSVVEGFDDEKGRYAVRVEGRKKPAALRIENCLAAVPGGVAV